MAPGERNVQSEGRLSTWAPASAGRGSRGALPPLPSENRGLWLSTPVPGSCCSVENCRNFLSPSWELGTYRGSRQHKSAPWHNASSKKQPNTANRKIPDDVSIVRDSVIRSDGLCLQPWRVVADLFSCNDIFGVDISSCTIMLQECVQIGPVQLSGVHVCTLIGSPEQALRHLQFVP